jgi:hypothetical protein
VSRVPERPAQEGDVALQRVHRRRRGLTGPHVVDEAVDGDELPRGDSQPGENRALWRTTEKYRLAVPFGADGTEQVDVEPDRAAPVECPSHPAHGEDPNESGPDQLRSRRPDWEE